MSVLVLGKILQVLRYGVGLALDVPLANAFYEVVHCNVTLVEVVAELVPEAKALC